MKKPDIQPKHLVALAITCALLGTILLTSRVVTNLNTHPTGIAIITGNQPDAKASIANLPAYVNPLIGTAPGGTHFGFNGNSGDTFPGAAYPMGMVQWSPDTTSNLPGGYYYPDHTIKGFSLTHFSGRGCNVYQDIPFMPYVGNVDVSPNTNKSRYYSIFSHSTEVAHPGYYKVHLDQPNVTAELTVSQLTGMGQFTYPNSSLSTMLINTGASIKGSSAAHASIDPIHNEVSGSTTSTIGCGNAPYTLYFVAQFDHTFINWGGWQDQTVQQKATSSQGSKSGAFVTFGTNAKPVVHVQIGISFVSSENARVNLVAEHPDFDFNTMRAKANSVWNTRLSSIQVTSTNEAEKTTFYTALYHVFMHPNRFNDANGQYLGFDGQVHTVINGHTHFENIPGWDEYRSLIRLLAIIAPKDTSDIAQSLVDDALQGNGSIPRWEQANVDSHGMNGDGGSIILTEAYAFGDTNFDTTAALNAMINGQPELREGLKDYLALGYIPKGSISGAASVTQEYTNADFAIAQFAQALGDDKDYKIYLQRSASWKNLFNTQTKYIQLRERDGSWSPNFAPGNQNDYTEGNAAQYSWMEPFDLRDLFNQMGGNTAVVKRLDTFFTQLNIGSEQPYAFMGNEPSFEAPWEYDFAQAPAHTQNVVRRIQLQLFKSTPQGLPGNDDGGSLSSWYVFSALGLYPEIPGVGGFVIGSPLFPTTTIQLAGGHTLQINAPMAADANPYVQNLKLNGRDSSKLWVPWSSVKDGATLDFSLGNTATNWGGGANDVPPSFPALSPK